MEQVLFTGWQHGRNAGAPEDIVFFSDTCADENGQFTDDPMIIILFQEQHSSIGLKFYFLDDYPLQMRIKWYDKDGYLTDNVVFEPDALTYSAEHQVKDYMKIEVTFERTKPYRYVKSGTSNMVRNIYSARVGSR